MPSVTFMGTGGPRRDPHRRATSLLLRSGEEEVLIDAGRGALLGLGEARANIPALRRILLTHHHFDHIGDLYDVILNSWLEGRRHPLLIEGPPGTKGIVDALLNHVYDRDLTWRSLGEPAHGGWAPVEVRELSAGEGTSGAGWRATAHEMSHGHGLPTLTPAFLSRWFCHGYRFELGGKIFAFTGDTVDCPGLRRLAEGADVLAICCYAASSELTSEHFRVLARHTLACGDTVGKIAAAAGVNHLVLTHHKPRPDDAWKAALMEEVARDFSGRISLATDGFDVAF